MTTDLNIRQLGQQDYRTVYRMMSRFTDRRGTDTADELWSVQHPPVFTLGLGGNQEHILDAGTIPVIKTDRGGQVTYHGPGQLIVYLLLDLKRRGLTVKQYVYCLEQAIIDTCGKLGVHALRKRGAPGVYVAGRKLAALGIRVRRGCSYHGLALNVDMDLSPFRRINPCGYPGLEATQLHDLGCRVTADQAFNHLLPYLLQCLDSDDDQRDAGCGRYMTRPSQAA